VVLYDVDEFWAPYLALLDHMVASGYVRAADRARLRVVGSPEELFAVLP
jgi:predicted Rossmann-fold nucleotide-binding protein